MIRGKRSIDKNILSDEEVKILINRMNAMMITVPKKNSYKSIFEGLSEEEIFAITKTTRQMMEEIMGDEYERLLSGLAKNYNSEDDNVN